MFHAKWRTGVYKKNVPERTAEGQYAQEGASIPCTRNLKAFAMGVSENFVTQHESKTCDRSFTLMARRQKARSDAASISSPEHLQELDDRGKSPNIFSQCISV
jgi:hypothetical protein